MALDIMSASIGYDLQGTNAVIEAIQTDLIIAAEEILKNNIPMVETNMDSFWIGASADVFKKKLEVDSAKLTTSLELIRTAMSEEVKQMSINVNNSDAVIAQDIMPGFDTGTYNSNSWEEKEEKSGWDEFWSGVGEGLESLGASAANFVTGAVEGVFNVVEWVADAAVTVATVVATPVTALVDTVAGAVTGGEWEPITGQMWDSVSSYVAEEHTKEVFDEIYYNTDYGKWIQENNIGDWEKTRKVGNVVGETAAEIMMGGALGKAASLSFKTAVALTTGISTAGKTYEAEFAKVPESGIKDFGYYASSVGLGTAKGVINGVMTYGLASVATGESKVSQKLQSMFDGKVANMLAKTSNGARIQRALNNSFVSSLPKYAADFGVSTATGAAGEYASKSADVFFHDGIEALWDKDTQKQMLNESLSAGIKRGIVTTATSMTYDGAVRQANESVNPNMPIQVPPTPPSNSFMNIRQVVSNERFRKGVEEVYENSNVTAGVTSLIKDGVTNPVVEILF